MKYLVILNGPMGVGKTATSGALKKLLPSCVFLDGDWCWDMTPFVVTEETKAMVTDNICHLLSNFLACSVYENILFCWVMHEQGIIDDVLSRLNTADCRVRIFSLVCSEAALRARLETDIQNGVRAPDAVTRSLAYLRRYASLNTEKIDVSDITAYEAAKEIYERIITAG